MSDAPAAGRRPTAYVMDFADGQPWFDRCCEALVGLHYSVVTLRAEDGPRDVEAGAQHESAVVVFGLDEISPERTAQIAAARRRWEQFPALLVSSQVGDGDTEELRGAGVQEVVCWDQDAASGALERALHRVAHAGVSQREMASVLAGVSDAVLMMDVHDRVIFSNGAAEELFGRSAAALASEGIDPDWTRANQRVTVLNGAEGSRRSCDVRVTNIRIKGARHRVISFRDVSEPQAAAWEVEELRASRAAILRALPVVMWIVDSELRVVLFRGGDTIDGKQGTERPGVSLREFLGEACADEILEAHRAALRGEASTATLSWLSRSWDVHVAEIEHDALPGGEALGGEAMAVCVDVTKRKKLQKALFDAQKLEAVGHLAGGVAHEINTPMQYVGDNLQFMEMALGQFEEAFELLTAEVDADSPVHAQLRKLKLDYMRREAPSAVSQSLEGVARVSKIIKALKQSALMESGPPEPTNLNQVVKTAVNVSQNEWKYTADVRCELDEALPPLLGVPGDLTRAILALLVNASQAIKERLVPGEKGKIVLRTFSTEDELVLEIRDDGGGIPAEIRDKIFHQFFTTKETGVGLGQGLTIARAVVVDRHGGVIEFEVDDGVGTTFLVKFPRSV